jgi:thiamine biosynthesis protein ThiS
MPSGIDAEEEGLIGCCSYYRYNFSAVLITLNGEPYQLEQPLSIDELLARLEIDPRRVAVEHNLAILRRHTFADTVVRDGDEVEIVNFVGGG